MKTLFTFGLCAGLCAMSLAAQSRGFSHPVGGILPPGPGTAALGGVYVAPVIGRPLGGVALPTFGPPANSKRTGNRNSSRYVGPVYYVPSAYDSYSDYSSYPPSYPPPPQPSPDSYGSLPSPSQPVVINQYFVSSGSSIPGMLPRDTPQAPEALPANPGDPLVEPQSYYLIAYKDHAIYSALTYWIEGDTLHYVTTQNTHNQASLNLIDVDRTYKLNSDRSVPFSVPGR